MLLSSVSDFCLFCSLLHLFAFGVVLHDRGSLFTIFAAFRLVGFSPWFLLLVILSRPYRRLFGRLPHRSRSSGFGLFPRPRRAAIHKSSTDFRLFCFVAVGGIRALGRENHFAFPQLFLVIPPFVFFFGLRPFVDFFDFCPVAEPGPLSAL